MRSPSSHHVMGQRITRRPRSYCAMAAAIASEDSFTFGRRRAIVVDRSSSETVGRITEPCITNDNTEFNRMIRRRRGAVSTRSRSTWVRSRAVEVVDEAFEQIGEVSSVGRGP